MVRTMQTHVLVKEKNTKKIEKMLLLGNKGDNDDVVVRSG